MPFVIILLVPVSMPVSTIRMRCINSLPINHGSGPVPWMLPTLASTVLSLPLYPDLTDQEIQRVCNVIHAFYGSDQ